MSKKGESYGQMLRKLRRNGHKSLGELARALGISTPYLCDIELDRRNPPNHDYTVRAAAFLGVDPEPLLCAAAASRHEIGITTPVTSKGQSAMIALQRRSGDLTDEQWERIQKLIDGGNES